MLLLIYVVRVTLLCIPCFPLLARCPLVNFLGCVYVDEASVFSVRQSWEFASSAADTAYVSLAVYDSTAHPYRTRISAYALVTLP